MRGYLGMHGVRTRVHALLMAGCLGSLFFSFLHPQAQEQKLKFAQLLECIIWQLRLELNYQRPWGRAFVWHRAWQGHTWPMQGNE